MHNPLEFRRVKPEFEHDGGKPILSSNYSLIETACRSKATQEAAVSTSAVKPPVLTWLNAPGTPVSETWETRSGPMSVATPKQTPIRKIVLKLGPSNATPLASSSKLRGENTPPLKMIKLMKLEMPSRPSVGLRLDIEQRLALFENAYQAEVDEVDLVKQLDGLDSEFMKDSVAVIEWINNMAVNIMTKYGKILLKDQVSKLVFSHLSCISSFQSYAKIIPLVFSHLSENASKFNTHCSQITSVLSSAPVEESEAIKMTANLLKLLNSPTNDHFLILRLISSVCCAYSEAKTMILAEIVGVKGENEEGSYDIRLLSCIIQQQIINVGEMVTEERVRAEISIFTEDFYRRIANDTAQAVIVLSRWIRELPNLLSVPELVSGPIMAKYLGQIAIFSMTSVEKFKIDSPQRLALLEPLAIFTSFLRRQERLGTSNEISLDYFMGLNWSLSERTTLKKSYEKLLEVNGCTEITPEFIALHKRLVSCRYLAPLTATMIAFFVRMAGDSWIPLRIKAMRSLISILDENDDYFKKEGFVSFIVSKLDDSSVSVRDVALEILGKCLSVKDMLAQNVWPEIMKRASDSSANVRKRIIRIYRDILLSDLAMDYQSDIVAGLLSFSKDEEETVIQLSSKVLKEQWLTKAIQKSADRQELVQFVTSIIKIIRLLGTGSDCIQTFMKSCQETKGLCENVNSLCSGTVDVLFESLIGSIEQSNWEAVKFILKAIDIFVGQQHSYLSPHLRLLYELSKSTEMTTIELSLKLMNVAMSGIDKTSLLQIQGCQQHLIMLILKGSEPVVRNAVELLGNFLKTAGDDLGMLISLWNRFANFLESKKNETITTELISPICRALFSLGSVTILFCENNTNKDLVDRALQLFVTYHIRNTSTASFYALQSLGSMLVAIPKLALNQDMSLLFQKILKTQRIDCILALLRSFVSLFGRKENRNNEISFGNSMKPSESNIFASIIQNYVNELVEISCSTRNGECQMLCFQILSFALVHGLCHPHQVIPSVVTLSTSPVKEVANRAAEVVRSTAETHPSFLFSNYSNIIRSLFKLHSQYPNFTGYKDESEGYESLLGTLYTELKTKKTKRQDMVLIIYQELEEAYHDEKFDYARFILENMAQLPLRTLEEACFIFQKANDYALEEASQYLNSDGQDKRGFNKTLMLLSLRKFLSDAFSLTLEKCEKCYNQEQFAKSAIMSKATEPFMVIVCASDEPAEQISVIKSLLDEQRYIENSTNNTAAPQIKQMKPKARSKKRRRKVYDCSEPESDDDINVE